MPDRHGEQRYREERGYSFIELLVTVALVGVVAAIAVPMTRNTLSDFRLTGDARTLSNTIAVAKIRAASAFSKARVSFDVDGGSYHVETWQKTDPPGWVAEGGSIDLSPGVSLGFGALDAPPPNTQAAIAQAPECTNDEGVVIANTACIVFNSRGIPIDSTEAPTAANAVYLTDGSAVLGVTVAATGMSQLWHSPPSVAVWTKQ